jgi:hypothetical protein
VRRIRKFEFELIDAAELQSEECADPLLCNKVPEAIHSSPLSSN